MEKNILTTLKTGLNSKVVSSITAILFLLQSIMPAYAAVLSSVDIEATLDLMPDAEFVSASAEQQYKAPSYVTTTSVSKFNNITSFFERLKKEKKEALYDPLYVPIAVGDITTILPIYEMGNLVGDTYVQSRFVRHQIKEKLLRNIIFAENYKDNLDKAEAAQLSYLYDNAFTYAGWSSTTEKFGDPITKFDRYTSEIDMIWPEYRIVNGKKVLVPVVYLKEETVNSQTVNKHQLEVNGDATLGSVTLTNVDATFRSNFINVAKSFEANNANVNFESENVQVVVGGGMKILSSAFNAEGNLTVQAHSVDARTIVQHFDIGHRSGGFYGQVTEINANGNITLISNTDIYLGAVQINAGDAITLYADTGNIEVKGVPIQSHFKGKENGYNVERSSIEYLTSSITAGDTIKLIANGSIVVDAAEIVSDSGHIEMLAGLGITIQDSLEQHQSFKKGKFGKRTTTESAYQTFAIRSLIDAGKGIKLHSGLGDINLKAANIKSVEGTNVTATNGAVNMLLTKETDHYSYSSVKEGMFTTSTRNKGHEIEKDLNTTVIGGFTVEAAKGVNVEFAGLDEDVCREYLVDNNIIDENVHYTDPNYVPFKYEKDTCLRANVEAISKMEGMSWMKDFLVEAEKNPEAYNWDEIRLAHDTWSKSSTTLSPAAVAVIAIAVSVYAGPAAGSAIQSIAGAGVISSALTAGAVQLMTQASVALANGTLNGGDAADFSEAFAALDSDENWKNLAISMVTAGALEYVNADVFSSTNLPASMVDEAGKLSMTGQAMQAVANSTVSAGIRSTLAGEDFTVAFRQSLGNAAVGAIGKEMANEIKGAWDNPNALDQAIRYIAHAGVGCILGVSSAKVNESDNSNRNTCTFGAVGAVTGELVSDTYRSDSEVAEDAEKLEQWLKDKGFTDTSELTDAQRQELLNLDINSTVQELREFANGGIALAQLSGGIAALLAGADAEEVNIASMTGKNAAENNGFWLIPIGLLFLKAADLAFTVNEYSELLEDYNNASTEEEKRKVLEEFFGGKVEDKIIDELLDKLIPGKTTVTSIVGILHDKGVISKNTYDGLKDKLQSDLDFEKDLNSSDSVVPSKSGSISKTKTNDCKCELEPRNPEESAKVIEVRDAQIELENLDKSDPDYYKNRTSVSNKVGALNEELTNLMMEGRGWKKLEGGTYYDNQENGGRHGFDHVFTKMDVDGNEVVMLVDSKQITNGTANLDVSNSTLRMQLSDDWITETVFPKLPDADPAKMAIKNAMAGNAKFQTAVAGLDKVTGKFTIFKVNAP